jgi:2,5-dihydroxypyridine 5,6-dioxygenase
MNEPKNFQAETTEREGAMILLHSCGHLAPDERVLIVGDNETSDVANLVFDAARESASSPNLLIIPALEVHGTEPPAEVAKAMLEADLILGLTSKSMAHTRARYVATQKGARYLSLPEYSMDLLSCPSLRVDFSTGGMLARMLADRFTEGRTVQVRTAAGTDISLEIAGRTGNCCPGYVEKPGELGSPPDIEANISPLETASHGVVVVDGSIPFPGFGLLAAPVTLSVDGGSIVGIEGEREIVHKLEDLFESVDPGKTRILAECGVGLNKAAQLTGIMLTDEGAYGTMHFGFGSNATVGGLNDVAFHVDFVFRDATLLIDDELVISCGALVQ